MSCPDHESLSAFADCEVDVAQVAAIERHLVVCASCREFVDEMRRLDDYGRASVQTITLPGYQSHVRITRRRIRLARPLTLAAAAAILVSLGTWMSTHRFRERAREVASVRL